MIRIAPSIVTALLLGAAACSATAEIEDGADEGGEADPPPPTIKLPPAPKDGSQTSPGCNGIPESGKCEDGVAVYCDVEGDELRRKDCRALGKSCVLDAQQGAMCTTTPTGGGAGTSACGEGITVEGSCGGDGGQTATWCDPSTNQTVVWDCDAQGLACSTECTIEGYGVFGAYCCDGAAAPPPPTNECPALGFEGSCVDSTHAKWCNGSTLVTKTCTAGQTCQVDACATGAYCCDVAPPPADECEEIGFEGICRDSTHPRWCSNGTVYEVTCAAGMTCQTDACGDGAFCCEP